MSLNEKKLLVINEVLSAVNESFLDRLLDVFKARKAEEQHANTASISASTLQAMAQEAESNYKSGKLKSSEQLLSDLDNW